MHRNIFVVSLFAVVIILQIVNGLPTHRFDTNYINEEQKLNGNNGFMIPSNNMPFKIEAIQTKNRPPAYGPSDSYSSQPPLTQQTSDSRPTPATRPTMETAPTSATHPTMETAPTSATHPTMETAPTSVTTPPSETPPTAMTKPTSHNY
ncbi:uncharacterized protein LOC132950421 [Metopolophium dirhodum]|uniref:uncharacterized protein LOC132950421 n=1 Tax=Metopolophium dirhodum TaxID=44670 RepID=UPI00299027A8|nr:uncharacterized protein LOC132950421 [Metopolophium dirhodum]